MPGVDFAIVRSKISLAQVLDLVRFVPARRAAQQLRGPCPMPRCIAPDRRSFSAHLTRNQFHCFHCGSAGSQLELWACVTNQTVYAAAIDLCRRLGVDIPWIRRW